MYRLLAASLVVALTNMSSAAAQGDQATHRSLRHTGWGPE